MSHIKQVKDVCVCRHYREEHADGERTCEKCERGYGFPPPPRCVSFRFGWREEHITMDVVYRLIPWITHQQLNKLDRDDDYGRGHNDGRFHAYESVINFIENEGAERVGEEPSSLTPSVGPNSAH
jgi:hypothetical protein